MRDEQGKSKTRKLQETGGSYLVTLPIEYGRKIDSQDVDWLKLVETGNQLVVKPVGATSVDSHQSLTVPDDIPTDDAEFVHSFLTHVVQSYCIAGSDEIEVTIPSSFDDETRRKIQRIFSNIEIDYFLDWDRHEQTFQVESLTFDEYVRKISDFINDHLIHPLSTGSVPISNPNEVHRREEQIDQYWALVMRTLGRRLVELERNRFPEALCGIYLSKYAEMIADIIVNLIQKFNEFAGRFSDRPELVEAVQRTLQAIFCGDGISAKPFDQQLRAVAEKSYALDVDVDDLQHQYNVADARSEPIERITEIPREQGFIGADDDRLDSEAAYDCGLLLGEIQSLSRTLVGFPRSMTFIGLGAKRVAAVHDIDGSA